MSWVFELKQNISYSNNTIEFNWIMKEYWYIKLVMVKNEFLI